MCLQSCFLSEWPVPVERTAEPGLLEADDNTDYSRAGPAKAELQPPADCPADRGRERAGLISTETLS